MNLDDICVLDHTEPRGGQDEVRLNELDGYIDTVPHDTPAEVVHQLFMAKSKLPGVMVADGPVLLGLISRAMFFQLLSRKNGLAVYHPRPISLMLEHSKAKMLQLSPTSTVMEAADLCLQREPEFLYEPIVVSGGNDHRLIDFHSLLIAQSQLLHETTQRTQRQEAMLKKKNREILDSIFYAQRIQKSMLRHPEHLDRWGLDLFLIFKPRDIVSGDFFYVTEHRGVVYIAAVDCTGHGVPGAFMALIGHNLLDDIITSKNIREPDAILSCLHESIRRSLNQGSDAGSGRDGMDACLCAIDPALGILKFSGAKRPLYLCSESQELTVINGDHHSLGGMQRERARIFTTQTLDLVPGQTFFLTTDGFVDQHSPSNEKIGTGRLKAMLQDIRFLPLAEKKQRIECALIEHQGTQMQRDDITLIGVEWLGKPATHPQYLHRN